MPYNFKNIIGLACERLKRFFEKNTFFNLLCVCLLLWEIKAYLDSITDKHFGLLWFNPQITSDDALQQAIPFYDAYHANIFNGDLLAELMRGYLAPIHYWLGYGITLLTDNPLMTCHWIMLIQIVLISLFIFLAIRSVVGTAPACLGVLWFFHTRPVIQRISGGLPRGWAAVVISAFIFFVLTKRHKCILLTILFGCLLHPPATLIVALAYGLYLCCSLIPKEGRKEAWKRFWIYVALSPFYAVITLLIVQRPDYIGQMVDFKTASAMPEFSRLNGRFQFIPLENLFWEIRNFAFQPFYNHIYTPSWRLTDPSILFPWWKSSLVYVVPFLMLGIVLLVRKKGRKLFLPLWLFLVSIFCVYFASRALAFKLYVPDRHLQYPMTIFWIISFCIFIWSAFNRSDNLKDTSFKNTWPAMLISSFLALIVYIGSGSGMYGDANFNYNIYKKGKAFEWLKKYSPEDALIAGHPTHIDAVPLFAMRKAYVTNEATHPFYVNYYNEMKRRYIISLKAHYATDWNEFLQLLEPEHIDYFVFSKKRFYPDVLANESNKTFAPLNELVATLTDKPLDSYVYKKLPPQTDLTVAPFMVYKDDMSAVVDIKKLRTWLDSKQ